MTREMAYPVPTKVFLKLSPDTAMLFAPFECTHPPPPVPPFLLTQTLSPKDVASQDEIFMIDISGYIRESVKSFPTSV